MNPAHAYVHVPFCARRCAYCDFSIAVRPNVPVARFVAGLGRELELRFTGERRWKLKTLYLGGGTPSRLGGYGIGMAIDMFRSFADFEPNAEITIEVNPEDVSAENIEAWLSAGVNRFSLGIQSFDDAVLKWMHRAHDSKQADNALRMLRDSAARVSADLIFSLPRDLQRDWHADVDRLLQYGVGHVSLYGLTIESGTPLFRWRGRGEVSEAPEDSYENEYLLADTLLGAAGFEHYEVSSFAMPGNHSRHNASYWLGAPYVGIGPSAHEFDGLARRWNAAPYTEWLSRLDAGLDPVDGSELLTAENVLTEKVYLGLRTSEGLAVSGDEISMINTWVEAGWGTLADNKLCLSPLGWLRLDALAAHLTAFRSRS